MKKFLSLLLCMVLCLICSSCGVDNDSSQNDSSSSTVSTTVDNDGSQNDSSSGTVSTTLLIDQENVKISFCGTSPNNGIGEGIYLLVENSRTESIIVNIAEVSLNDVMQTVIQPQMPLHLTSSGKQSKQPFVFVNTKDLSGKAQFKIKILNENFEEIFVSDFVEVSF